MIFRKSAHCTNSNDIFVHLFRGRFLPFRAVPTGSQAGRWRIPPGGAYAGEAARLTLPTKEKSKKLKKYANPLDN